MFSRLWDGNSILGDDMFRSYKFTFILYISGRLSLRQENFCFGLLEKTNACLRGCKELEGTHAMQRLAPACLK